jgi:hypothetical protein
MKLSTLTLLALLPVVAAAQTTPSGELLVPDGGRSGILFGTSVATSDQVTVVGASFDALGTSAGRGSAFVYVRDGAGQLQRVQRLLASDGMTNDYFGAYVEMVGNEILVGAIGNGPISGPRPGAVYVFNAVGTQWQEQQKLVPLTVVNGANFGQRFAIGHNLLLVNGRTATQAIVHVFERIAGQWAETGSFQPTGGGSFASHISLSGNAALIGAAGATNTNGVASGAAYVFDRNGSVFSQTVKLTASDGLAGDNFGFSASIWENWAVVGASGDDVGGSGDRGSAYVYERTTQGWVQRQQLLAPDGATGDGFGKDVRICGDRIFVGAPNDDDGMATDSGGVYRFALQGGSFVFEQKYQLTPGRPNSLFGDHLGISPLALVTGAPFAGQAYGYNGGCDVQQIRAANFE